MPRRRLARSLLPDRLPAVVGIVCLIGAAGEPALAQQAAARAGLTVSPTLSVTETLTDSYRHGDGDRSWESVTVIGPGLRLNSRSGRVQGSLNYSLNAVLHARDSDANSLQHRLTAALRAEVVPSHFDVHVNGSISRQAASAFGLLVVDPSLTDENQTEVRSFSVRPVLRGVLAGAVNVQASATASYNDSSQDNVASTTSAAALSLSSASPRSLFGWGLNATRDVAEFDAGRETTTDRVIGSVLLRPDPELQLTLRGGKERTDIASVEQRTYDNWGAGLLWLPGPRTQVSLDYDRRYFGNAHAISLQHRMRRSVWRYTDSRSVGSGVATSSFTVRAYDLFFVLFASQEPDPVLRDALVRSFLERNGIPPDALIGGGFLTRSQTVQRRQELSLALNGQRTNVVFSAYANRSERADTVASVTDDLSAGPVRQRGLSVTVSHRLTPRDSLSLNSGLQRSDSQATGQRSTLASVTGSWSTRLSERSNFSLSVRHAEYDAATDDYSENALTAAFSTRF